MRSCEKSAPLRRKFDFNAIADNSHVPPARAVVVAGMGLQLGICPDDEILGSSILLKPASEFAARGVFGPGGWESLVQHFNERWWCLVEASRKHEL